MMSDIQGSAKRVRFSECAAPASPALPAPCSANDVFELEFELLGGTRWRARPTYTHQFFDEEEVHGYAGLRATLKLSRELTHSLLEVSWQARLTAADDVPRSVADGLPMGCACAQVNMDPNADACPDAVGPGLQSHEQREQLAAARSRFTADAELTRPFCPPGMLLSSYTAKPAEPALATPTSVAAPEQAQGRIESAREVTVEVWRAPLSDAAMRQQWQRMEPLFLWYIDGASAVDVDMSGDPSRWQVYTAYEAARTSTTRSDDGCGSIDVSTAATAVGDGSALDADADTKSSTSSPPHNPSKLPTSRHALRDGANADSTDASSRAVVAFASVYAFETPFHGTRVRICQVLVLPPYQRRGHGAALLRAIYADLLGRDDVTEVTVEDPAPGFTQLRNRVDLAACLDRGFFAHASPKMPADRPADCSMAAASTVTLTEADVRSVQRKLKLTARQVRICYEAAKLRHIRRDDETAYKKFRLEVKRRLNHERGDQIEAEIAKAREDDEEDTTDGNTTAEADPAEQAARTARDKELRKKILQAMYLEVEAEYDRHLQALGVAGDHA